MTTALIPLRSLARPALASRSATTLSPFLLQHLAPTLARSLRASHPSFLALASSRSLSTSRPNFVPPTGSAGKEVTPAAGASSEKAIAKDAVKKGTRLQRIWGTVKKEALHYWHGTKLLGKEIRISARIQGRLLAGKKLTRRERRQVSQWIVSW